MLILPELVQSFTWWHPRQPCWPHPQGTQNNDGGLNFIPSYYHYSTLAGSAWLSLSLKQRWGSLYRFTYLLPPYCLFCIWFPEGFFVCITGFDLGQGFFMPSCICIMSLSEVYSSISFSTPLRCINIMCLQNLTLGLTSCLLNNVILYFFFYHYIWSQWLLFPWLLYSKSLCRVLFITPQITPVSLWILFVYFFTYVRSFFVFIWVHFHVFSLLLSGFIILGLVHLKSCIYMGNCALSLHTAPAFEGLLSNLH